LTVDPANVAAGQLYKSLGFAVERSEVDYFGDREDRLVMIYVAH
jgi:ribosomal protein S18 acetylase RimI-like enzyme